MKVAIITLDAFNELDSFIASALLGRVKDPSWDVRITGEGDMIRSMNGVEVKSQAPLSFANQADIVLFGSGMRTADFALDDTFIGQFELDPNRQLIGAQCSGALFLNRLGLGGSRLATDTMTRSRLEDMQVEVSDKPLEVSGNVASAGGCLASHYLAGWAVARKQGWEQARNIIHYVAPVGQKDEYADRAESVICPFL